MAVEHLTRNIVRNYLDADGKTKKQTFTGINLTAVENDMHSFLDAVDACSKNAASYRGYVDRHEMSEDPED